MESKRKEYMSIVFRNIGFAFFAPFGTILFQWVVFKSNILDGHFYYSIAAILIGCLFVGVGYIILREAKK